MRRFASWLDYSRTGNGGERFGAIAADKRRRRLLAAAVVCALSSTLLPVRDVAAQGTDTHLLKQVYLTGLARIARGDPAGAVAAFEVVSEVAPDLPQAQYSLALAMVLSDFEHRERALPVIGKALAADPQQPLFDLVRVMADPDASVLRDDGALYLTAEAAGRLRVAARHLGDVPDGYNARYLAPVLGRLEPTGDAGHPFRLPGFGGMVGQNGTVSVPQFTAAPLTFGRLFALSVSDARFDAYEGRFVAHLQDGLASVSMENVEAARKRSRLDALREQMQGMPRG